MHGSSAGTLIWIGIVLFAVIVRMVKSGERARSRTAAQPVRPVVQPTPPRAMPAAPPPMPKVVVRAAPTPAPLPPAPSLPGPEPAVLATAPRPLASPQRSSVGKAVAGFADRGSMIRAIVAAEVIGPPKAFVELDNWSHRHREA